MKLGLEMLNNMEKEDEVIVFTETYPSPSTHDSWWVEEFRDCDIYVGREILRLCSK